LFIKGDLVNTIHGYQSQLAIVNNCKLIDSNIKPNNKKSNYNTTNYSFETLDSLSESNQKLNSSMGYNKTSNS